MDRFSYIKNGKLLKKGDIAVLAILVVSLAVSLFFAFSSFGSRVEVYSNGQLIHRLPLSYDTSCEVKYNGSVNTIIIKSGKVRVEDSTCLDKLCESTEVFNVGQTITCLPNRLVIKLIGKQASVDGEV